MQWKGEWALYLPTLLNAWKSTGIKPVALNGRPELTEDQAFLQGAYEILDRSRPEAYVGIRKIPLVEIQAFCELFGVEDREYFAAFVRAADDVMVAWITERHQKEEEQKAKLEKANDRHRGTRNRSRPVRY